MSEKKEYKRFRCGSCGRFCTEQEVAEYDSCEKCSNDSWESYAAEMRELDPHGPYGDQSRYSNR